MDITTASVTEQDAEQDYAYLGLLRKVKEALSKRTDIMIPATNIQRYRGQPRVFFNQDSLIRLSQSIDQGGQISPGLIRREAGGIQYRMRKNEKGVWELEEVLGPTDFQLIDGERRWRAVLMIPPERRPDYHAQLIEADDHVIKFLIAGVANFNRQGHAPMEVANTIETYYGQFKIPMKEIATLLGISDHWARQLRGLVNLDPEVSKLLSPELPKNQQLPVAAAIEIAKVRQFAVQKDLAQKVMTREVPLGRVRGEVIKAAQEANVTIRLREVEPRKQWESFGNRLDLMLRTAGEAEHVIGKELVSAFVKVRPRETAELLKGLKETRESLSRIEDELRAAQHRR